MSFPTNELSPPTNDFIDNVETCELLKARDDLHDGVIVEIENMQIDVNRFTASLEASLSEWARQGKKGVWLKVATEQANLVRVAIMRGFWYHHAEISYVMLVYCICQTPPTIPDNAAVVFNDQGEVRVDQEMYGPYKDSALWRKKPTGRINQGEGINEASIIKVVKALVDKYDGHAGVDIENMKNDDIGLWLRKVLAEHNLETVAKENKMMWITAIAMLSCNTAAITTVPTDTGVFGKVVLILSSVSFALSLISTVAPFAMPARRLNKVKRIVLVSAIFLTAYSLAAYIAMKMGPISGPAAAAIFSSGGFSFFVIILFMLIRSSN